MGFPPMESGILKLVYPGGVVEIHKKPITAEEVMKRNPRHCVTSPDMFKFPWPSLVVRPESVLKPGKVFFIVPYRTIHHLLQSKESQSQHLCPNQKVTFPTRNHRKNLESREFSMESANFHQLFQKVNIVESASLKEENTAFLNRLTHCYGSKFFKTKPLISSTQRVPTEYQFHGISNCSGQIIQVRSCLKKEKTSMAKSRSFRVRFALDEDNKRIF